MKGDREKCLSCGMDDYMTKPVQGKPFIDICSKWVVISQGKVPIPEDTPGVGTRSLVVPSTASNNEIRKKSMKLPYDAISDAPAKSSNDNDIHLRKVSMTSSKPLDNSHSNPKVSGNENKKQVLGATSSSTLEAPEIFNMGMNEMDDMKIWAHLPAISSKSNNSRNNSVSTVKSSLSRNASVSKARSLSNAKLGDDVMSWNHELVPDTSSLRQVMVVDDSTANLMALKYTLQAKNLTVTVQSDGADAVAEMQRWAGSPEMPYGLILMDLHMPLCSGLKATALIRKHELETGQRYTPIVGVTANADTAGRPDPIEVQECIDEGMDALITKPATDEKLQEFLNRFIFVPVEEKPSPSPSSSISDHHIQGYTDAQKEAHQVDQEDPIDLGKALEMAHGDFSFVCELLQAFLPDCVEKLQEMFTAAWEDDGPTLKARAHTIKGAASVVGADSLVNAALQIESALREEPLSEGPMRCTPVLDTMLRIIRACVIFLNENDIPIDVTLPDLGEQEARIQDPRKQKMEQAAGSAGDRFEGSLDVVERPQRTEMNCLQPLDVEVALHHTGGDFKALTKLVRSFMAHTCNITKTLTTALDDSGDQNEPLTSSAIMLRLSCIRAMAAFVGAFQLEASCDDFERRLKMVSNTSGFAAAMAENVVQEVASLSLYLQAIGGEDESESDNGEVPIRSRSRRGSRGHESGAIVVGNTNEKSLVAWQDNSMKAQWLSPDCRIKGPELAAYSDMPQGWHVIVVDLEPITSAAICSLLHAAGYRTTEVGLGIDWSRMSADLVVTNLSPEMLIECTMRLRQVFPVWEVPLLALLPAGLESAPSLSEILGSHINDIITMPTDAAAMMRRVQMCVAAKVAWHLQAHLPNADLSTLSDDLAEQGEELMMLRSVPNQPDKDHDLQYTIDELREEISNLESQLMNDQRGNRENVARGVPELDFSVGRVSSRHRSHPNAPGGSVPPYTPRHGAASVEPLWQAQDTELWDFLCSVGLSHYAFCLETNAVQIDILSSMSDEELRDVGINAVGARIRIREALQGRRGFASMRGVSSRGSSWR